MMREVDMEILHYVREAQSLAPVSLESIHKFLVNIRQRGIEAAETRDRVADLVDEQKLEQQDDWVPGEGKKAFYRITARGRDVLDGVIPPDA